MIRIPIQLIKMSVTRTELDVQDWLVKHGWPKIHGCCKWQAQESEIVKVTHYLIT